MVARKARSKDGRLVEVQGRRPTSCKWIARHAGSTPATMRTTTLYDIVGLDAGSSLEELRRAAKSLLSRSHPDLGGDRRGFADALAAWDAFRDDGSRARYDASLILADGDGGMPGASISFTDVPNAGPRDSSPMSWWKDPWEQVHGGVAESWASKVASCMWEARFCTEFDVGAASSGTRWWIEGGIAMASSSIEATESDANVCAMLLVAGFKEFGGRVML